jgi:hypothetical protein
MTDNKLNRMMREEHDCWLKSRGPDGGSLNEFQAHLAKLMETNSEWRNAAIEEYADAVFAAWKALRTRMPKPRPLRPSEDTKQVHRDFATVRDLYGHADFMLKQAKTKAQRAEAERLMDVADMARERAGGNLDFKMRDLVDAVWPARDTRQ